MAFRICFVYPWATQGGVERVFLNRILAFQRNSPHLEVDLLFLHDSGGAEPLRSALKRHSIDERRVSISADFAKDVAYDLVFCVDCPQAFDMCERRGFRYVAECHTSYLENRKYLRHLPAACERIIVPSELFGDRLRKELPEHISQKLVILRNFIPWDVVQTHENFRRPGWVRTPLLFFGRMDKHKNPLMLLDALALLEQRKDHRFFVLLCGTQVPEIDLQKAILKRGLHAQVMQLPPVPFSSTNEWLKLVKDLNGIYISPSLGESFGLAAAEAISVGMPVLLSDIAEHRFLVNSHEDDFLFPLDSVAILADKIVNIRNKYTECSVLMEQERKRFSSDVFMNDWLAMLEGLDND